MMQYNVENLFDTVRSAVHNDADFTPEGKNHWLSGRYWAKLRALARVIAAAGGASPIDIVGMVEVENDSVLRDLTKRTPLRTVGYEYCITRGRDARGINVALLYQPAKFSVLTAATIPVVPPVGERPTRDILRVEGLLPTRDSLTIFVVHFPSSRGGYGAAGDYRSYVAGILRAQVDSIQAVRPAANIVVMGDMNDELTAPCLSGSLGARMMSADRCLEAQMLYEALPTSMYHEAVGGTYFYQNQWGQIDHILLSASMLSGDGVCVAERGWKIFDAPFLLETDLKWGGRRHQPKRTFLGASYHRGISDHLPLVVYLELKFR